MKDFRQIIPATVNKINSFRVHRFSVKKPGVTVASYDLTRDNLNRPKSCKTLFDLIQISDKINITTKKHSTYGLMITGIKGQYNNSGKQHIIYYVNDEFAKTSIDSFKLPLPGKRLVITFEIIS